MINLSQTINIVKFLIECELMLTAASEACHRSGGERMNAQGTQRGVNTGSH
jgi:hypothetical protein